MIFAIQASRWRLIGVGVAVFVIVAMTGWYVGSGRWSGERTRLSDRGEAFKSVLYRVREERKSRPELDARRDAILERSLGGELERVDAALRARLVAVGERFGLRELVVSTSSAVAVESPARREFKRTARERSYRDEPDFVVLRAGISGEGTFEQIVDVIHAIDAAPWLKRIESVRLDPDADGRRIRLGLGVATIFEPDYEPVPGELPPPTPKRVRGRYAELVASTPFAVPAVEPVPVASRPRKLRPPAPKVDPRTQWRLTGLIEGDPGSEAWFRHLGSGRTLTLLPDAEAVLGGDVVVRLVEVGGDIATLRIGNETCRVLVGSTLDRPLREEAGSPQDRSSTDRTDS